MTLNVTDANVWLALLLEEHMHHAIALRWYRTLQAGEAGLCRLTHLSVIRLLGSRQVTGPYALPAAQSWLRMEELIEDERVEFLSEPPGLNAILPTLFRYKQPTPNLVNDAYLAAFAITSDRKLVTFDRGFLEFPGLDVEILA
jgi:toxin-antitoxin system PIN domain toxin